jgi:hypothetical protein
MHQLSRLGCQNGSEVALNFRSSSTDVAAMHSHKVVTLRSRKLAHRILILGAFVASMCSGASQVAGASSSGRSASDYGLSTGPIFQSTGDKLDMDVSYTFTLVNGSSQNVRVRVINENGRGLAVIVPPHSNETRDILSHRSIKETIDLHVSSCGAVRNAPWPLPIEVSSSSNGWRVVSVDMTSAGPLQWQKFLANSVCD